ncbi:dipeptide epimerase [Halorarum salinum]|uniref:Dipeptide epimerase n=1 Tax=Halorarum salinum TaxID=2743089 RepID=A0A7D5QE96_9EURY|nr:dipeptide epimerase [Halobaculum salinum]
MDEPFEIALGTQHRARNVIVRVETEAGTVGWGEGSPIPPVTGETQEAALASARAAAELLEGESVAEYHRLVDAVRSTVPGMVSASFAVETALLDAYCRARDVPMSELFGGPPEPVETDLTIPIVPPEAAGEAAAEATEAGFTHLKVKTGGAVDADVERVAAVAEAAPEAELKVDANQGWTVAESVRFARAVRDRDVDLALLEQPVRADDVAGLARVRDAVAVPVAADEAVFTPGDALSVVHADAADVINVKLGKSGPLAAAEIVAIAEAANLELMVGCMLESAVGIHASAHLVAGSGAFSYVDLDGNLLLAEDVVDVEYGPIVEIDGPGHGVVPRT